jgi:hypothetical protein
VWLTMMTVDAIMPDHHVEHRLRVYATHRNVRRSRTGVRRPVFENGIK